MSAVPADDALTAAIRRGEELAARRGRLEVGERVLAWAERYVEVVPPAALHELLTAIRS